MTSGDTGSAVYASVKPPRSAGTETILISANWVSRDGGWNLRGVATLLAMGDFLRGMSDLYTLTSTSWVTRNGS